MLGQNFSRRQVWKAFLNFPEYKKFAWKKKKNHLPTSAELAPLVQQVNKELDNKEHWPYIKCFEVRWVEIFSAHQKAGFLRDRIPLY